MRFLKAAALAAALLLAPAAALAQTSPGWPFGYVPTAAEWNAAFAGKADYTGSMPITAAGGTFTGKVNFLSSSAGTAGMNCGVGTTPSSPINGDIWCTSAGMFVQINGSTIPLGTSGGTLAVTGGGTGQTSFTANLPILGNGTSALVQGTVSGTGTQFGTVTGTKTSGDCLSFDASGNIHSAGVGACGGTGGAGTVSSATTGQLAIYTAATTVSGLSGCNNGYFGTNGGGTVSCITSVNTTLSGTITALGTIATGTWQGTVLAGQYGGTGVANTGFTITLAGNLTTSGANNLTLTTIGATNVTLPTTGTLMNQNGTSGGIPYYNTTTSTQSSAALTLNAPVIGGGAGASPAVGSTTDGRAAGSKSTVYATYSGSAPVSTHCAQWDANGNLSDSGATCAGASGGAVLLTTINCASTSGCTDINGTCPAASSTTGCFTNLYSRFEIDLENMVATTPSTAVGCQIHVYNSGGGYQTTGYLSNYVGTLTSTNITQYVACWPSNTGLSNSLAAPGVSGSFIVVNPSASAKAQIKGFVNISAGGTSQNLTSGGWWNTNSAIVGFRVCAATSAGTCGATWASGTIKVYGLP
jgi:hypothetical protein